jgi:hypothetical protein
VASANLNANDWKRKRYSWEVFAQLIRFITAILLIPKTQFPSSPAREGSVPPPNT